MIFEDAAKAFKLIEKVAPILAEILISPAAGVGTTFVMQILHDAFGVDDKSQLPSKILSDPEAINKLKDLNHVTSKLNKK